MTATGGRCQGPVADRKKTSRKGKGREKGHPGKERRGKKKMQSWSRSVREGLHIICFSLRRKKSRKNPEGLQREKQTQRRPIPRCFGVPKTEQKGGGESTGTYRRSKGPQNGKERNARKKRARTKKGKKKIREKKNREVKIGDGVRKDSPC